MEKPDMCLLGVSVAGEADLKDPTCDLSLGVVLLPKGAVESTSLSDLRQVLVAQLPSLPAAFTYITREGWPIKHTQEVTLRVHHIISDGRNVRVQRGYAKPRVGILTVDKRSIGFVFIDHNESVASLRNVISDQLNLLHPIHGSGYQFVDRNGWPVTSGQEVHLCVLDLLSHGAVSIRPPVLAAVPLGEDTPDSSISAAECSFIPSKHPRISALKQIEFQSSKDADRRISVETAPSSGKKQLLLSYVRSEAAQHALLLKEELTHLGFSVFLDVHEIKLGVDWQDALNFAVRHCEVFIPLVTPRYGETQWTNREVKLADVLGKFILPVNFLDQWPPECLAIQFATTQFVPWKPPNEVETDSVNNNSALEQLELDHRRVAEVANRLAERLHAEFLTMGSISPGSSGSLVRKISMLRSCPCKLPPDLNQLSQPREGSPMVLISLHPQEKAVGERLQELLVGAGYEVWLSTSILELESDLEIGLFSQDSVLDNTHFSQEFPGCESLIRFQMKADEAGVVVFIVSKAFVKSKTCQQQVFYCEHRKRILCVRTGDFFMPGWMSMLIGTRPFEDVQADGFESTFLDRIKLGFAAEVDAEHVDVKNEMALCSKVRGLKEQLPKQIFIYIAGSTTFYNARTEAICKALGKALANLGDMYVITGGFYGVGEAVGVSFHEELSRNSKTGAVYHVVPRKDDQDRSRQCRQNPDKTFEVVPYGKTLFAGDCVRERENIVSKACDICILIEGGPGAAHEAEQFSWNGNIVVPVMCTGGAAGGKFNVPRKIFEKPLGVSHEDWLTLRDENASPHQISQSLASIVSTVKDRLSMDSPSVHPEKIQSYFSQKLSAEEAVSFTAGMALNVSSKMEAEASETFTELRRSQRKRKCSLSLSRENTLILK